MKFIWVTFCLSSLLNLQAQDLRSGGALKAEQAEHQSMIAYGNQFKYTKVGGEDFDWLLNHEFGHEWWANKVTSSLFFPILKKLATDPRYTYDNLVTTPARLLPEKSNP